MRGLIAKSGIHETGKPEVKVLIFVCPKCGSRHAILISERGWPEPNQYFDVYGHHVWLYKLLNWDTIQVTPSVDLTAVCGYHGPSNWTVEVRLSSTPAEDNAWLADGLQSPASSPPN